MFLAGEMRFSSPSPGGSGGEGRSRIDLAACRGTDYDVTRQIPVNTIELEVCRNAVY